MSAGRVLFRAQLRRDRWQLLFWIVGITWLLLGSLVAIGQAFGGAQEQLGLILLATSNPAFLFLRGVPSGLGVGAILYFQLFNYLAVLAGFMSTFLVIRHTRGDEEHGRAELIGATVIRRGSPLLSVVALGGGANLALGLATAAVLLLSGLSVVGSTLTGAAVAAAGLSFVGVAAVTAQLMPTSRGANGLAAALVGGAYLVRGAGDAVATRGADPTRMSSGWISWLSPIGWGQRVDPFGTPNPAPLLLSLALSAGLIVLALRIRSGRDLGSGLLRERTGPASARTAKRSALGLAWSLQWPSLVGWCVASAGFGTLAGALAPTVADALRGNAAVGQLIGRLVPGTGADLLDLFPTAILGMTGLLAAAAGVQATTHLRGEEATGRAELLLATPLARPAWLVTHSVIAAGTATVVAGTAGLAAALAFVATGHPGRFVSFAAAGLAHAPAALIFVAIAALVYALLPRFSIAVAWTALAAGILLGQFGELLRLPLWLQNLSPFRHSPALPAGTFDPLPVVGMTILGAVGVAAAAGALRLRDLPR